MSIFTTVSIYEKNKNIDNTQVTKQTFDCVETGALSAVISNETIDYPIDLHYPKLIVVSSTAEISIVVNQTTNTVEFFTSLLCYAPSTTNILESLNIGSSSGPYNVDVKTYGV